LFSNSPLIAELGCAAIGTSDSPERPATDSEGTKLFPKFDSPISDHALFISEPSNPRFKGLVQRFEYVTFCQHFDGAGWIRSSKSDSHATYAAASAVKVDWISRTKVDYASRNWFRDRNLWARPYSSNKKNIAFPYPWKASDVASALLKLAQ
jgi:hypothetical protein